MMVSTEVPNNKYLQMLEYINSYGIFESCNNDHIVITHKLLEQDYKLNKDLIYVTTIDKPIVINNDKEKSLSFIISGEHSFFQKQFATNYGFYSTEKINNGKNYRVCFFTSYYPIIYDKVINNLELVKGFITFFQDHNKHIIEYFDKIRNDFNDQKNKYFKEPNNLRCNSTKDNLLDILKFMDLLHENATLTSKEWFFIETYRYGKSHNINMNHIFDLSKDEMDTKFNAISNKLLKEHRIN